MRELLLDLLQLLLRRAKHLLFVALVRNGVLEVPGILFQLGLADVQLRTGDLPLRMTFVQLRLVRLPLRPGLLYLGLAVLQLGLAFLRPRRASP